MEYFEFRTMALRPGGSALERTFGAVHKLIASAGGDADIGERLPGLLEAVGMEVERVQEVRREGRPGDPLWRWLEGTHDNHVNLVEAGLLEASELEAFYEEWGRASGDPDALFVAPPVRVITARKR